MLYTKFQGNWPAGFGEEDFTLYGHGGHLGQVCSHDLDRLNKFSFLQ